MMQRNSLKPTLLITFVILMLTTIPMQALEVDAGLGQVVAMNDLLDPNSPVDANLLDPAHPSWPVPFATDPNTAFAVQPVTVQLDGSHDVNTPVTMAWTVTDANQAALVSIDDASVLNPNVTFAEPNLYSLTLSVDDGSGPVTDTVQIKVKLVGNCLQAHWKFDGDPNDPNDYDWNYTDFTGTPDFGPGLIGDALILARDDSISYGNSIGAETSISVAYWMRPSADVASDGSHGTVRKYSGNSSDPQGGWTFMYRSADEMRFRCSSGWDSGSGDLKVQITDAYPTETWTHICGSYDGATSEMKFYIDGQLAAERTANDTCFDNFVDEMIIGSEDWDGLIDDLYLFDYAISADEVRALVLKGKNVAPEVTMDPDQIKIVQPQNEVTLSATVVESGLYTAAWTVLEAPAGADVQFADPEAVNTTAQLSMAGNYRLQLTVTDQGAPPMSDAGEVVVKVRPEGFDGLEAHITFDGQNADSNLSTSVPYIGALFGEPTFVEGLSGQEGDYSVLLDGEDDHVNYDAYLGSDPNCTIALWVGNDDNTKDTHIIQKWASDSSNKGWMIRNRPQENDGQIATMIGSGFSGAGAYFVTEGLIPAVNWTHIAITYDGTLFNVYVNGVQVQSEDIGEDGYTAGDVVTPMVIGYRWNNDSRFFKGAIDEVRIYDYALSAAELQALYEADRGE